MVQQATEVGVGRAVLQPPLQHAEQGGLITWKQQKMVQQATEVGVGRAVLQPPLQHPEEGGGGFAVDVHLTEPRTEHSLVLAPVELKRVQVAGGEF